MGLLDALRDPQFRRDVGKNAGQLAQSMSNTAAGTVTAPVDALAWLLRRGGLNIQNPMGGSDWAAQQGLTQPVPEGMPKMAGETLGLLAPMAGTKEASAKIAQGLRQMGANAAAPAMLNKQAGMIRTPLGQIPESSTDVSNLGNRLGRLLDDAGVSYSYDKSRISPSRYYTIDNPKMPDSSYTVRISNHRDVHKGGDISVDPQMGATFEQMLDSLRDIGVPVANRVKADRSLGKKIYTELNKALGLGDGSLIKGIRKKYGSFGDGTPYKQLEQELYAIAGKPKEQYTKADLARIKEIMTGVYAP